MTVFCVVFFNMRRNTIMEEPQHDLINDALAMNIVKSTCTVKLKKAFPLAIGRTVAQKINANNSAGKFDHHFFRGVFGLL